MRSCTSGVLAGFFSGVKSFILFETGRSLPERRGREGRGGEAERNYQQSVHPRRPPRHLRLLRRRPAPVGTRKRRKPISGKNRIEIASKLTRASPPAKSPMPSYEGLARRTDSAVWHNANGRIAAPPIHVNVSGKISFIANDEPPIPAPARMAF